MRLVDPRRTAAVEGEAYTLRDGSVVIASITSCTNTSNPYVMIGAGLVARKARALGLTRKPWVKTSLAPGSQVVSEYLEAAGLQEDLDAIGFNLVGYGCTTCIGNSGPLQPEISRAINDNDLIATSVLSGNRNFEGRISPDVRANYLASPPLVVAYALAGDMNIDITREPLAHAPDGVPVYLKDIWPSQAEIAELVERTVTREAFRSKYADVFKGDEKWQAVGDHRTASPTTWPPSSNLRAEPALFPRDVSRAGQDLQHRGRPASLPSSGDMVTTEPHQPGGLVQGKHAGAGRYLTERQVTPEGVQLLRLAARQPRGDDARHLRQQSSATRCLTGRRRVTPKGPPRRQPIADLSMERWPTRRQGHTAPSSIFAAEQYGAGSSRDWAATGNGLLGCEGRDRRDFERIHRSNPRRHGSDPFAFTGG